MYTIFKNDCSILLTDCLKNKDGNNFYYWKNVTLKNLLFKIDNNKMKSLILYHSDMKLLWKEFSNQFKIIEAAGGIVSNKKNDILFIFRLDKWDLPKGKVEKGEAIQETAIREVQEECGINKLTLGDFLYTTYHTYKENNKEILKISHWFKMFCDENKLIPQIEEDITRVAWKNKKEVQMALENSYPNIKLLIEKLD